MNGVIEKANQAATAANARQIGAALAVYAAEHDAKYPDTDPSSPTTANQAFRVLFREGLLENEGIFSAIPSRFQPDRNIGDVPERLEALTAGENHWAMTKGATTKAILRIPIVFENPVRATWPPTWNVDAAKTQTRGRAWSGGKIIVGFNDLTVEVISLQSRRGTSIPPARDAEGKDVFTRAAPRMGILDIEE